MGSMQNNKTYVAARQILFSLIGACAPTDSKPTSSSNMEPTLAALSYSWKTNYAVLAPPIEVQQKANAACVER